MRNRKRVFYNSHAEEALYAMIRAAALRVLAKAGGSRNAGVDPSLRSG